MEFQTINQTNIVNTRKPARKHKKLNSEQRTFIKNNEGLMQEMNSGYKERINSISYDPIEYETVPIQNVHYDENGRIDTKKNRIDFKQPNWYAQFQYYRELLSQQPSYNESALNSKLHMYIHFVVKSIVHLVRQKQYLLQTMQFFQILVLILLIMVFKSLEKKVRLYNIKLIVNIISMTFIVLIYLLNHSYIVNVAVPVAGSCSTEDYHKEGNHTAIFRPRSYSNIYHFLEGSSQMIRLALHPQDFPSVSLSFSLVI